MNDIKQMTCSTCVDEKLCTETDKRFSVCPDWECKKKGLQQAKTELEQAWNDFVMELCYTARIDVFMQWMTKMLQKKAK